MVNQESTAEFISRVEIFSAFNKTELESLAVKAQSSWYDFGDPVFNAGDNCSGIHVVRSGTVRIFTDDSGKEISMGVRKAGDVLAEAGALKEHRYESSVRASARTEILFIPRNAISLVLAGRSGLESFLVNYIAIHTAGGAINKLFDLKGKVEQQELEQFVRTIGVKRVTAGKTILQQGTGKDNRLYVIRQGEVKLIRQEEGREYSITRLSQGEIFGEHAALEKAEQPLSAIAETDVMLLVVPAETLDFVLEKNPQYREILQQRVHASQRELNRQRKLTERRTGPIIFDLGSRPKRGERVLARFPLVEQAEEVDCGAASLAMICRHYGISASLGKLREMANVTTEGATLDSLARAGETLGFTTRGMKCTYESLLGFEMPFIAHWEGCHYIVVYGISKRHVWVADPARGFARLTVDQFEKGWTGTCLLFTVGKEMAQLETRSPWVRFAEYLRPYKTILGHLLLATLVIELLGVAPPVILQNILDRVVVHHNVELLHVLIVGLIIAHIFTRLTTVMRGFLSNFMTRNLDFTMISHFFKHTLSLPLGFFDKRRTGDVFARFQENLKVRNFLTEATISTLLNLLMTFVYFIVLFMYNVKMTLILIACVIPLGILTLAITPKIKDYARRAFETSTDAEALLMETISGAETVKAMGIERSMRMRWEKKYTKALNVQYRAQRFDILVGFAGQMMSAITTVIILWVGATMVLSNQLTIGQLIAFNMLMGSVMSPLMGLIGLWDELQETAVAMERLGDVLDIEPEQKTADVESRILLPELEGHICMENLYFRYGGKETPYVLENINLEIKPGELVAIVGPSGSGKTTLAKLIVGFYPPSEGKITVDGYDLAVIDKEYYRRQIGYVMQNNLLFSGSIVENIAAGDESPDKRRVVEAARVADAHGFISAMPLGYEQIIGERGMGLSGGQMQRLCIARALYHDPGVLILDEATSSLDAQTESSILKNMQEVLEGRTALVIAHRLSTVMNADKILVLHNGNIVEQGPHSHLVDRKGMYYQLVKKQMSGG